MGQREVLTVHALSVLSCIFSKMEILYRSSSNFHSLIWLKKEFPQCINILKFAILGYSSIAKYKKNLKIYIKIKLQLRKALHRVKERLRTGSRNLWFLNTVNSSCWKFKSAYFEQRLAHYFCRRRVSAQAFKRHFPAGSHCHGQCRNSKQLWSLPCSFNFLLYFVELKLKIDGEFSKGYSRNRIWNKKI